MKDFEDTKSSIIRIEKDLEIIKSTIEAFKHTGLKEEMPERYGLLREWLQVLKNI